MLWIQLLLLFLGIGGVNADVIFEESFDTPTPETRGFVIKNGALYLSYSSNQPDPPAGVEYTLPEAPAEPEERRIDLSFLGGGAETSNSLFIAYALGGGTGWSLPPLPSITGSNHRTGYIIRLIRHGDGTNEIKFYRNDEGWVKELKNDWTLSFNPTTALRRTTIKHGRDGKHRITIAFDTGISFEKIYAFQDQTYLPDNTHRGLQLIAKGHAAVNATFGIMTDTWVVENIHSNGGGRRREQNVNKEEKKSDERTKIDADTADITKAKNLYEKGEYRSAQKICLELLQHDPGNADVMCLLGIIEISMENYAQANTYLLLSLDIYKKIYGPNHLKVAGAMAHLAGIYRSKDPDTAEKLYLQSLAVLKKVLGRDHIEVAAALENLGEFYRMQTRYSQAESFLKRSLKIYESALGRDHVKVVRPLQNLTALYNAQGRYGMEIPLLERLITIQDELPLQDTDRLQPAQNQQILAYLYQKTGQIKKAEILLLRSLETKEKILGPDHPDVAKCMFNLAVIYQNSGKYSDAETLYTRSIKIREKALGGAHPFLAGDLYNLAVLYTTQGRYGEAEPLLKRALEIFEKSLGPNHQNVVETLGRLSNLYRKMGRISESDFYANLAQKIRGG